ncbi:hypothetical protein AB0Q95_45425 [Streptomyces sp. NPDC059900]|uniref:hypothetical protein n=1 Tax=Streptomyces sp. NPDC059900 TaxID=3155816 RepID=UPI003430CC9A
MHIDRARQALQRQDAQQMRQRARAAVAAAATMRAIAAQSFLAARQMRIDLDESSWITSRAAAGRKASGSDPSSPRPEAAGRSPQPPAAAVRARV